VKIGIAAENRPSEKRVIMRPEELRDIASSHEVIVEKGAGIGVGFPDSEFEGAGCKIGSRKEVYACGLILKIKELKEDELKLTKPGSILMSMMHLRCAEELENSLKRQKLIAIPLENIKDQFGKRKVEAVEDSGRIGMEYGFKLWGKDPAKAQVKIMGYGNIAVGAIRCAARKLARVEILNKKHFQEMEKHIPGTDILVDAVNRPYRRVIVDLVSNPVNHAPVETMKPTTLNDPSFVVDGIHHTSCWGWPGFEPETITRRYSIQLKPIVMEVADKGINGTNNLSEDIKKAVMDFRG
jgi:alanine dehydrogenase